MAKLKLNPDPTFVKKVEVPVPGGSADVEFVFRYRDRAAVEQWVEETRESADVDVMVDIVAGWDLDDECNRENMARLCNSYPGAAREAVRAYLLELSGIRLGN